MELSKRAIEIQASPIRKLAPYADEAKARGIQVYHLNIGQPDIETPKEIMDMYNHFDEKVLCYGPSQGLLKYRKNLVNYYKSTIFHQNRRSDRYHCRIGSYHICTSCDL